MCVYVCLCERKSECGRGCGLCGEAPVVSVSICWNSRFVILAGLVVPRVTARSLGSRCTRRPSAPLDLSLSLRARGCTSRLTAGCHEIQSTTFVISHACTPRPESPVNSARRCISNSSRLCSAADARGSFSKQKQKGTKNKTKLTTHHLPLEKSHIVNRKS